MRNIDPTAIDWYAVILDLERHGGVSVQALARLMNRPFATVYGWKQGSFPRHHDGERLLELWCVRTANNRDSVFRVGQTCAGSAAAIKRARIPEACPE